MAYNGFAIDEYLDAEEITKKLDVLKSSPVYSIKPDELKKYEEDYRSKERHSRRRTAQLGI